MRKLIYSGILFLIVVLVLITSIMLAETYNHMLWWQVIGVAFITLELGRQHMALIKEYKQEHKN